jgi:hypothetical protein
MSGHSSINRGVDDMNRQHIDDGGWFDSDAAARYTTSRENGISAATGSEWSEEMLYITRKGVCVLWHHSRGPIAGETWRTVDATEAAEWLVRTGHDITQDKKIRAAVDAAEV